MRDVMKTLLIALGLTAAAAPLATPAHAYYLRDCLSGAPCPGFYAQSPRYYVPPRRYYGSIALLWSIALLCSAPAILWSIALLCSAPAILRLRLGQPNHLVILALLPQGILKISQKVRQHYVPSCRRAGRLPTRLKESEYTHDRTGDRFKHDTI